MSSLNLVSVFGLVALGFLAWLIGGCRRPVPWRTVLGSAGLVGGLAILVFAVPITRRGLHAVNSLVNAVLERSRVGAEFLFGPLAVGPGQTTATGDASVGFVLATQVLPAVVFFASVMALLFHARVIQPVVRGFALLFRRTLVLSGAEALAGASNIFFGVEAATTVRPYLERMTRSELLTVLTCGMSTVASTTLAVYVLLLGNVFPQIAGHLISASVLSIPAAAMISKLILPETNEPQTLGQVPAVDDGTRHGNAMAAIVAGSWDGVRLAAGIAAVLVAVLSIVGVADLALQFVTSPLTGPATEPVGLTRVLGWVFTPVAWLLGIEQADLIAAGRLLGERLVLTEVVAYQDLGALAKAQAVSPRTLLILSYALCGFAHVASVGIFVGGFAALAPSRRDDLAALAPRALVGATLATLMTGALAGAFYHGQSGVLGL